MNPILRLVVMVAAALAALPVAAQTPTAQATYPFRLGYSSDTISDASDEAAVVTRELVQRIAMRMIGVSRAETLPFSDLGALKAALKAGQLDVVIVSADEYPRLEVDLKLDPALSAVRRGADSFDIGLLVRRDSGISSLEGLRGLPVLNAKDQPRRIQSVWIETELIKAGFSGLELFSSFKEARSPSQAIMSVFFGQAAGCVVALDKFEVATELNPQLATQLTVIARSPEFSRGVVAFRADYPKVQRDRAYDTMLHLHEDVDGRQIMSVFRHERMVPFRLELLDSSRALMADLGRLRALRERKSGPAKVVR